LQPPQGQNFGDTGQRAGLFLANLLGGDGLPARKEARHNRPRFAGRHRTTASYPRQRAANPIPNSISIPFECSLPFYRTGVVRLGWRNTLSKFSQEAPAGMAKIILNDLLFFSSEKDLDR
jgi:hypothetical protein